MSGVNLRTLYEMSLSRIAGRERRALAQALGAGPLPDIALAQRRGIRKFYRALKDGLWEDYQNTLRSVK